jgi:hypothetical protein
MADQNKRLDESFSKEALRKSLEGTTGTRPAVDRLQISPSGHVQPKATSVPGSTSQSSNSGRSDNSRETRKTGS